MTGALRTPDERFTALPGFPWQPRYLEWRGLRLAYIDEGDGTPVVLFHGEPTWSFLYRHVMAVLLDAGYRVIAPDLPGFGRSDKPTDPDFYTYDTLTAAARAVVESVAPSDATAVVQDWGGPIGLRVVTELPERFTRLSILNTALFTGRRRPSAGFAAWRAFVERTPELPIGWIMRRSATRPWDDAVIAGYEAPFPDASFGVGAHRFPLIVPLGPEDPGAAQMQSVWTVLADWDRPTQVLFGTADPVFPLSVGERWVRHLPGATHLETVDAGHFLQEDAGPEVGRAIAAFLAGGA